MHDRRQCMKRSSEATQEEEEEEDDYDEEEDEDDEQSHMDQDEEEEEEEEEEGGMETFEKKHRKCQRGEYASVEAVFAACDRILSSDLQKSIVAHLR